MDRSKIYGFNLELIEEIVKSRDVESLYRLENNSAFSIALHQILINKYEEDPTKLNTHQMNLFLCMHLENSGQSCGILGCLQEWFPHYNDKFVKALREIKAPKSADAIEEAIRLLPKDGSWFFDSSNSFSEEQMSKLDRDFSDYPDGNMNDLYRKYAQDYKAEIIR